MAMPILQVVSNNVATKSKNQNKKEKLGIILYFVKSFLAQLIDIF